jgi:hypothetical protein
MSLIQLFSIQTSNNEINILIDHKFLDLFIV